METMRGGKKRAQTLPRDVRYTINESSRQFPDDAAIACDYKVKVVGIEWISFQIRIVNCLTDKAKEMGIDWWVNSPMFRKERPREIPESISQSTSGGDIAQLKKRNLHLATRRPA